MWKDLTRYPSVRIVAVERRFDNLFFQAVIGEMDTAKDLALIAAVVVVVLWAVQRVPALRTQVYGA